MDFLLLIPHELLSVILKYLDPSTIFSLKLTAKKYNNNQLIRNFPYDRLGIIYIRWNSISNKHFDMFKWLVNENDIKSNIEKSVNLNSYIETAAESGNNEVIRYFNSIGYQTNCDEEEEGYFCYRAAGNGHVKTLKYLIKLGCHLDMWDCFQIAACHGHLKVLKYIFKHYNINPSEYTNIWIDAAGNGYLEVIKYLRRNKFPSNTAACTFAASNGHLDVIKYLHKHKFPWNTNACTGASEKGHLEVLQYLHKNGCPWNKYAYTQAAANGHLEVLQYLHENGCPH